MGYGDKQAEQHCDRQVDKNGFEKNEVGLDRISTNPDKGYILIIDARRGSVYVE